jgi:hypothetical protein
MRSVGEEKKKILVMPGVSLIRCRSLGSGAKADCLGGEIEDQETLCLHDVLATRDEDPSMAATRRLDWTGLVESLDSANQEILCCLIEGADLGKLLPKLKRSRRTMREDKQRLAALIRERLGQDILNEVQALPRWRDNLSAKQEKFVCRYERLLA